MFYVEYRYQCPSKGCPFHTDIIKSQKERTGDQLICPNRLCRIKLILVSGASASPPSAASSLFSEDPFTRPRASSDTSVYSASSEKGGAVSSPLSLSRAPSEFRLSPIPPAVTLSQLSLASSLRSPGDPFSQAPSPPTRVASPQTNASPVSQRPVFSRRMRAQTLDQFSAMSDAGSSSASLSSASSAASAAMSVAPPQLTMGLSPQSLLPPAVVNPAMQQMLVQQEMARQNMARQNMARLEQLFLRERLARAQLVLAQQRRAAYNMLLFSMVQPVVPSPMLSPIPLSFEPQPQLQPAAHAVFPGSYSAPPSQRSSFSASASAVHSVLSAAAPEFIPSAPAFTSSASSSVSSSSTLRADAPALVSTNADSGMDIKNDLIRYCIEHHCNAVAITFLKIREDLEMNSVDDLNNLSRRLGFDTDPNLRALSIFIQKYLKEIKGRTWRPISHRFTESSI